MKRAETEPPDVGRGIETRSRVSLEVNGERLALAVEPRRSLLNALRHDLGLRGTKKVCDMGDCGACTVLIDGNAVYSCLVLAVECEGHAIETIESLGRHEHELHPLQHAFIAHDALQCGFCTPGQIMSLKALFDRDPSPSEHDIVDAITGNLCRCGAYQHIVSAAMAVARQGASKRDDDVD